MTRHYTEYNDTIRLRQRDIGDIIQKSHQTGCKYYICINLAERSVWMGFKEPFESSIDRLHALYYKIPTADDDIKVCVGLWSRKPSNHAIEHHLCAMHNSFEPVIRPGDAYDLLKFGRESRYLEMTLPTYKGKSRFIEPLDFNLGAI